jgi:NAD-dependent dihydropyrimidine dehydrogenase PreA subunit
MNRVLVRDDECKGCAVCVSVCPHHCLAMSGKLNAKGYEYVQFIDPSACTACGLCFLSCPEPGALAVLTGGEDD